MRQYLVKNIPLDSRMLRAMTDIYVVSFRNLEDTPVHDQIKKLSDQLKELYPDFNRLKPLGLDYASTLIELKREINLEKN